MAWQGLFKEPSFAHSTTPAMLLFSYALSNSDAALTASALADCKPPSLLGLALRYPTGLGALVVRKDVIPLLRKRYFAGGTVLVSVADEDFVQR